jgi:hypothetical protein
LEATLQSATLAPARIATPALALPAFATTLFLSAGLMFMVEPMIAKMVLPRLGGSPAVWSTCMVFFQAVLLLGYAYAHALTRLLPRPAQIGVHIAVLLPLAALALPLDLGAGAPSPGASPALWLLVRLALVVGLPMFAISATAPLLQRWFADLDHEASGDPYFLYAASNAGSLLALLAYPLLIEPMLPLDLQATLWSGGFGIMALGLILCATATVFSARHAIRAEPQHAIDLLPPLRSNAVSAQATGAASLRERLTWTVLAFVPSSLLLGVTTYITADVAAAPLLWVVPLILYLLSFILVFARRPPLPHAAMLRLMPLLLIPLVITAAPGQPFAIPLPFVLALHLGCFFIISMVCHGELARRRPPVARLTEFYLFLSIGGVLGGIFNALLAPLIFPGPWEYPLALVAACLLKPAMHDETRRNLKWDLGLPAALLGLELAMRFMPKSVTLGAGAPILLLLILFGYGVPAIALLSFSARRLRFALGIAVCLLVPVLMGQASTITTQRSFFGIYRVLTIDDGHARLLMDGTTLHGAESLVPGEENQPLTYYSHAGPFGRFFASLDPAATHHVAVVGLGAGSLACYAQPGQDWTFYEIDPLVERLARDPRYFHYMSNCGNDPQVVLGDARLTLAAAPDGAYDLLVLDAFSSDTVPMHLLTREAMALYLRKLAPGGKLLFHISSRTLDLGPVLSALAADAGIQARMLLDHPPPGTVFWRREPALVVALAGRGGVLDRLDPTDGWTDLPPAGAHALWTDQRSDILRAIRFGL